MQALLLSKIPIIWHPKEMCSFNFTNIWLMRTQQWEDTLEPDPLLFNGGYHQNSAFTTVFGFTGGLASQKGLHPSLPCQGFDSLFLVHWLGQCYLYFSHRFFQWLSGIVWGWDFHGFLLYMECKISPTKNTESRNLYFPTVVLILLPDSKLASVKALTLFFNTLIEMRLRLTSWQLSLSQNTVGLATIQEIMPQPDWAESWI